MIQAAFVNVHQLLVCCCYRRTVESLYRLPNSDVALDDARANVVKWRPVGIGIHAMYPEFGRPGLLTGRVRNFRNSQQACEQALRFACDPLFLAYPNGQNATCRTNPRDVGIG